MKIPCPDPIEYDDWSILPNQVYYFCMAAFKGDTEVGRSDIVALP